MSNAKNTKISYVDWFLNSALGLTALTTLVITNLGVILRYIFEQAMPWNEEAVKFLFVWMIFVGFAQAFRQGGLVGIMFLEEGFKKRKNASGYRYVKILQGLVNVSFGAFCAWCAWDILSFQFETEEATTVLEIPLYLITSGVAIGFLLFTMYAVQDLVKQLRRS